MPVDRLVTNILCKKHNEQLGTEVDAEAVRLSRTLKRIREKVLGLHRPLSLEVHELDAKRFERWIAKTFIDFVCVEGSKDTKWQRSGTMAIEPPVEIVNAIFCSNSFEHPMGLYLAQENTTRPSVVFHEAIDVQPSFHPEGGGLVGGFVKFAGLRFLIWLFDEPFDAFIAKPLDGSVEFGKSRTDALYHPDSWVAKVDGMLANEILFKW